jgi:hypothetical protein
MTALATQPAEIHVTLEIKRAATGETEVYQMTGRIRPDQQDDVPVIAQEQEENNHI